MNSRKSVGTWMSICSAILSSANDVVGTRNHIQSRHFQKDITTGNFSVPRWNLTTKQPDLQSLQKLRTISSITVLSLFLSDEAVVREEFMSIDSYHQQSRWLSLWDGGRRLVPLAWTLWVGIKPPWFVMPTLHWTKKPQLLLQTRPSQSTSRRKKSSELSTITKLHNGRAPGWDDIAQNC